MVAENDWDCCLDHIALIKPADCFKFESLLHY